jgi:hypothetical protein
MIKQQPCFFLGMATTRLVQLKQRQDLVEIDLNSSRGGEDGTGGDRAEAEAGAGDRWRRGRPARAEKEASLGWRNGGRQ